MTVGHPAPGFAEVDTDHLWFLVQKVITEALASHPRTSIDAVGVSAMLGWVFLDANRQPLAPAFIYMDNRAVKETAEMLQLIPGEQLFAKTGRRASPLALAPKIKWLKKNRPAVFLRVAHVIGLKDDIIRRLTGAIVTDFAHLNYSMLFNITEGRLDADILDALEIKDSFFAAPSLPTCMAGTVRPAVARKLGLPSGLPVIIGSSDGTSAMYGGGILEEKTAVLMSGTTDVFMMGTGMLVTDLTHTLNINTAAVPDTFLVGGPLGFSGATINYLQDILQTSVEKLQGGIAGLPPGADGLLFLPGLSGERAPYWMEYVTGSIVGLTVQHREKHILRAAMEATAFRILKLLDILRENRLRPAAINVVGGGSQLDVWNQIRADVTGLQIRKLAGLEATCLGTALFCKAALDPALSLKNLCRAWIKSEHQFFPEPKNRAHYRQLAELFNEYIQISAPVFKRLSALRKQPGCPEQPLS
jgi:xylulokinase